MFLNKVVFPEPDGPAIRHVNGCLNIIKSTISIINREFEPNKLYKNIKIFIEQFIF